MRALKKFGILLFLLSFSSKSIAQNTQTDKSTNFDSNGKYKGAKQWQELIDKQNKRILLGFRVLNAVNSNTLIKIGYWQTLDLSNKKISQGEYQVGLCKKCCNNQICQDYYDFKIGTWKFFYSNGQLKASGTYKSKLTAIESTCGSIEILTQELNNDWKIWNEDGSIGQLTAELKSELESLFE